MNLSKRKRKRENIGIIEEDLLKDPMVEAALDVRCRSNVDLDVTISNHVR